MLSSFEPAALPLGNTTPITLAAGIETEVLTVDRCGGRDLAGVTIQNVGDNPLTACRLQRKLHAANAWSDYLSGSDWQATTNANLRDVIGGPPNSLDAGATCQLSVRANAAWSIRLLLTSAGGTTVIATGNLTKS